MIYSKKKFFFLLISIYFNLYKVIFFIYLKLKIYYFLIYANIQYCLEMSLMYIKFKMYHIQNLFKLNNI